MDLWSYGLGATEDRTTLENWRLGVTKVVHDP